MSGNTMEKLFSNITESFKTQTEYSDSVWLTLQLAALLDTLLISHPELEQEYNDFSDSLKLL